MIQCVYKVRETKPRSRKKDLKNRKKFLTNFTRCGIIKKPRGQEPLVNKKWVATIANMKGVYYD